MKAKKLAGYLLEHPEWDITFVFYQVPDEIDGCMARMFKVTDIGDVVSSETFALIGDEDEDYDTNLRTRH